MGRPSGPAPSLSYYPALKRGAKLGRPFRGWLDRDCDPHLWLSGFCVLAKL